MLLPLFILESLLKFLVNKLINVGGRLYGGKVIYNSSRSEHTNKEKLLMNTKQLLQKQIVQKLETLLDSLEELHKAEIELANSQYDVGDIAIYKGQKCLISEIRIFGIGFAGKPHDIDASKDRLLAYLVKTTDSDIWVSEDKLAPYNSLTQELF